ncbi:MAG: DNA polymerase IV [Coprobacillus sp.]|nr:DNA polymerase IV [Coprobacillus sp.]
MSRVIVHLDLNTFFVRCEEIKDPTLEGKAVAIGHNGRSGIISTCSYKAREYGVHSGMPTYKALEACPTLILIPGDYSYYQKKSREFFTFIEKNYTKVIHAASIDEMYADFTDCLKGVRDVPAFFTTLQERLFKETRLRCSIGVATTLFLAKMGSDYKKPNGITIIHNKDIAKIIYPLPIEDMFGIGKKTQPRLHEIGINTIGDLKEKIDSADPALVKILGKYTSDVKSELEGTSSDVVPTEERDPKSIGHSTTLPYDTSDPDEIIDALLSLSRSVCEDVKKEKKKGNTVQITLKDTDFKLHNKSMTLPSPTDDPSYVYQIASSLYENNFIGLAVRLVGVTLQNLVDPKESVIQMSLFNYEEDIEESQTKLLIDSLNSQYKKDVFKRASEAKKK